MFAGQGPPPTRLKFAQAGAAEAELPAAATNWLSLENSFLPRPNVLHSARLRTWNPSCHEPRPAPHVLTEEFTEELIEVADCGGLQ